MRELRQFAPVIKVNNRNLNADFYTYTLGFKILNEENAFVDLGDVSTSTVKLILEEAPSMRVRSVNGFKKLHQIVVKVAQVEEITALLANGAKYQALYRGPKGWAFSAISPEGDAFLLHGEVDYQQLIQVEAPEKFEADLLDFKGLTQFNIEKVMLNTPVLEENLVFYSTFFEDFSVLNFEVAQGPDLQVSADETWDLTGFEVILPAYLPLLDLVTHLEAQNQTFFVDKKSTFLVLQDPNGLELRFRK